VLSLLKSVLWISGSVVVAHPLIGSKPPSGSPLWPKAPATTNSSAAREVQLNDMAAANITKIAITAPILKYNLFFLIFNASLQLT